VVEEDVLEVWDEVEDIEGGWGCWMELVFGEKRGWGWTYGVEELCSGLMEA
jgi:hypothetical protein